MVWLDTKALTYNDECNEKPQSSRPDLLTCLHVERDRFAYWDQRPGDGDAHGNADQRRPSSTRCQSRGHHGGDDAPPIRHSQGIAMRKF